jgi:hypothetical protein
MNGMQKRLKIWGTVARASQLDPARSARDTGMTAFEAL